MSGGHLESEQKVLCQIGKEYVKLEQGVVRRVQQLFCKDREEMGQLLWDFRQRCTSGT